MEFNINGWEALVIIILIISAYNLVKEIIIAITYNNVVKKILTAPMSKEERAEAWTNIVPPLEEIKEKPKKTRGTKKNED